MRTKFYTLYLCVFVLLLAIVGLIGCDSITDTDDGSVIYLYNYDEDHEYYIHLYLVSDSSLIDSCQVEEYGEKYDDDSFEDVDEGYYYLSIFRDLGTEETGRSGTFHLEDDEDACYEIDDDGDISSC